MIKFFKGAIDMSYFLSFLVGALVGILIAGILHVGADANGKKPKK